MFHIKSFKPMTNTKPIHTIEKEMLETRARYNEYLKNTNNNYMAQRGDVKIKDPHTMVGNAYQEIREFIDPLAKFAKKNNKEIVFEDARALTRECEDVSPIIENEFAKNVLISVKDKSTGEINSTMVNKFEQPEEHFMAKVFSKIEKLISHQNNPNTK